MKIKSTACFKINRVCVHASVCCINQGFILNEKPLQINTVISVINHPAGGGETAEIMGCQVPLCRGEPGTSNKTNWNSIWGNGGESAYVPMGLG